MGLISNFFGANPFGGIASQAGGLESTAANNGNTLFGQSQGISSLLSPYYSNMVTDPQGLGATALTQQLTQAGQGAGGAAGAAKQRAIDIGARTGNTAAIPGIISSANKTGMTNMSDITNNLALKNTMLKQQQQQQGAAGLSSLFGQDLGGSTKFGSLANDALKTEDTAAGQEYSAENKGLSNIMGLASGVMGGIGNLDMSGGSNPMEQLMSFAGGM